MERRRIGGGTIIQIPSQLEVPEVQAGGGGGAQLQPGGAGRGAGGEVPAQATGGEVG